MNDDESVCAGVHHQEPATTPYSCHGVFTDRSIFSLNLSRIQVPTGTSMANCNQKHGLMLTYRHDVDMFTRGRIVLSLPKRAHVDWNWPIYLKIDWFVKMLLHWLIMGVAGSQKWAPGIRLVYPDSGKAEHLSFLVRVKKDFDFQTTTKLLHKRHITKIHLCPELNASTSYLAGLFVIFILLHI